MSRQQTPVALPEGAERLYTPAEVDAALDAMAAAIDRHAAGAPLHVLAVMVGGIVPCGLLLPRLATPVTLDYLHATRYRGTTRGGEVQWLRRPAEPLSGRRVLVVDDVLDEGQTLAAILDACRAAGASEVLSAVLVRKRLAAPRALAHADFEGLEADDRYLFGYGMDYFGALRNAPGIYAIDVP